MWSVIEKYGKLQCIITLQLREGGGGGYLWAAQQKKSGICTFWHSLELQFAFSIFY